MDADASPRILVARLSAVGDCILTMPLACAIRKHFPQAFIGWVVQGGAATLLKGHPAIDQVIVAKKGWLQSPQEVMRLRRELRSFEFDMALDPQSLSKSAIAAWLSGAPRRIGLARPQGRELAPLLNNQTVSPRTTHVTTRQLELLRPMGIEESEVCFGLPLQDDAADNMRSFVERSHLQNGYAAINPGAGWDSRLWPAKRFGRVARHLGERRRLPSLAVWSGSREKSWAEEIVANSGGHALLAPQTTLPELAALAKFARLFVSGDTGPMHLAAAMGTPCVSLHGPTRPEVSGPYGEQHQTVQAYYQDGPGRRGADNQAMLAITVEDVCQACTRVLERRQEKAA
ncbi:MAG: glycosyltransferase family 9 protein [Planctomycetes bacterium]|nr:glycosyltransferase family 9 protein [Planctomycetota bacterium]